jgi:hypothetical protein
MDDEEGGIGLVGVMVWKVKEEWRFARPLKAPI